jgi:hypothetical protein
MPKQKLPKMETKKLLNSQIQLLRIQRREAMVAARIYQQTLDAIVMELGVSREKLGEWTLAENDSFIFRQIPPPPPPPIKGPKPEDN